MPDLDELVTGSAEDWLSTLPEYQRQIVDQLLTTATPEEAAMAWLAASGPANTQVFGASQGRVDFYERVSNEVRKFLSENREYSEDRARLLSEIQPTPTLLVATISAAIAPELGLAAALVAPAITLVLILAAKVGLRAWCAGGTPADSPS
jgi:hypothetical protein